MAACRLKYLGHAKIRFPYLEALKSGKTVSPGEVITVSESEKKGLMKMTRGTNLPLFEIQEDKS